VVDSRSIPKIEEWDLLLKPTRQVTHHILTFEMPQGLLMGHQQSDLLQYLTPIKQVEEDTGTTFFNRLEAGKRVVMEGEWARGLWGV